VFGGPWLLHLARLRSFLMNVLAELDPVYAYAGMFRSLRSAVSFTDAFWIFTSAAGLSATLILCSVPLVPRSYSERFSFSLRAQARTETFLAITGELTLLLLALALRDEGLLLALGLVGANLVKLTVLLAAVRVLGNRSWLESLLTTPLDPLSYLLSEAKQTLRKLLPLLVISLSV
jgi:hypothetical protein